MSSLIPYNTSSRSRGAQISDYPHCAITDEGTAVSPNLYAEINTKGGTIVGPEINSL
jgi:hypothetical protein